MTRLRADLPNRPRAVYRQNPLVEVICAVRFPRLLELSQDMPAKFQRHISADFPFADVEERYISITVGKEGAPAIDPSKLHRTFKFRSEDSKLVVSLEPELLALTNTAYRQWEDFLPRFRSVLETLCAIYAPRLFTRVGLRFRSVLTRELVQLAGHSWREMIRQPVLATAEYFAGMTGSLPAMELAMVLDIDPGKLRIHLNTVRNDKDEEGFLIDTDCFVDSEKFRSLDEIVNRVELLHGYSGKVFQACITDTVHHKLDPEPPAG